MKKREEAGGSWKSQKWHPLRPSNAEEAAGRLLLPRRQEAALGEARQDPASSVSE